MNPNVPTVFVVDDDPAVLKGLSRLLRSAGSNVVTFSSPLEFLEQHDSRAIGCLVLDVSMPGLDGLRLQEALAAKGSEIPIIFLTGRGDIPTSVRAMKSGARDFLTKPVQGAELLEAVRNAIESDQIAKARQDEIDEIRGRLARLTPRERQVLEQVISGKLNKQIAAELGAAEKTVKIHRGHVMHKMQVCSVAELVRLAEKGGVEAR